MPTVEEIARMAALYKRGSDSFNADDLEFAHEIAALFPAPPAGDEVEAAKNPDLPRLLRIIASSSRARETRHDIIFNAAADELDASRAALSALHKPEEDGLLKETGLISELRDAVVCLRQHLALFCGPDDAIANAIFQQADAVAARARSHNGEK